MWRDHASSGVEIKALHSISFHVTNSDIDGGWSGTGNIDSDPLFIDTDGEDDIPGTEDDDFHLRPGSPCIDTGTDNGIDTDIDGEDRPMGAGPDMGSDEYPESCWDLDLDGHTAEQCGGNDCDDADPNRFPRAQEICENGIDDNCNDLVDSIEEGCTCRDEDNDGYLDAACGGNDCNDLNPLIYPGALERCDGEDSDCDGIVPDNEVDADDDHWALCSDPPDCDDNDAGRNPGIPEICGDGVDNDCSGEPDDKDFDLDGQYDLACGGDDCNDLDPDIYSGADELCDGRDNDCDGDVPGEEEDVDEDGWRLCSDPTDCDDDDPGINPGVIEDVAVGNCDDGMDNDCDGFVDNNDPECGPPYCFILSSV